jgi:hypothetical protein
MNFFCHSTPAALTDTLRAPQNKFAAFAPFGCTAVNVHLAAPVTKILSLLLFQQDGMAFIPRRDESRANPVIPQWQSINLTLCQSGLANCGTNLLAAPFALIANLHILIRFDLFAWSNCSVTAGKLRIHRFVNALVVSFPDRYLHNLRK